MYTVSFSFIFLILESQPAIKYRSIFVVVVRLCCAAITLYYSESKKNKRGIRSCMWPALAHTTVVVNKNKAKHSSFHFDGFPSFYFSMAVVCMHVICLILFAYP